MDESARNHVLMPVVWHRGRRPDLLGRAQAGENPAPILRLVDERFKAGADVNPGFQVQRVRRLSDEEIERAIAEGREL